MISQRPVSCADSFGGYGFGENRILHSVSCQDSKIPGCGIMSGAVQSVGVLKMGSCHAKHTGLVVHEFSKALHSSAAVNGQRHCRVVSRGQHQPIQKLLEGKHLSLF